jgi:hypothetical protein
MHLEMGVEHSYGQWFTDTRRTNASSGEEKYLKNKKSSAGSNLALY